MQAQVNCASSQSPYTGQAPLPDKLDATCAEVPHDFSGGFFPEDFHATENNIDLHSWLLFVALNWPADEAACVADKVRGFATPGPRDSPLWLTWRKDTDIMADPKAAPKPWCQNSRELLLRAVNQATSNGILVDRNGLFVRYMVVVNKEEYDYIVQQSLWTHRGQLAFSEEHPIEFPWGDANRIGAIEVKAAWKVIGPGDDASHFLTRRAVVYNGVEPRTVTVGLVGLHIAHKTRRQPGWIWSTFEQVNNTTRSFHHDCKECSSDLPVRELDSRGRPVSKPTPIEAVANEAEHRQINDHFRKLLAGTVWSNYRLVATQWVVERLKEKSGLPQSTPCTALNPVLETFASRPGPEQFPPSCIRCHEGAHDSTGSRADFSWVLQRAADAPKTPDFKPNTAVWQRPCDERPR
jgi:hypothetical protein